MLRSSAARFRRREDQAIVEISLRRQLAVYAGDAQAAALAHGSTSAKEFTACRAVVPCSKAQGNSSRGGPERAYLSSATPCGEVGPGSARTKGAVDSPPPGARTPRRGSLRASAGTRPNRGSSRTSSAARTGSRCARPEDRCAAGTGRHAQPVEPRRLALDVQPRRFPTVGKSERRRSEHEGSSSVGSRARPPAPARHAPQAFGGCSAGNQCRVRLQKAQTESMTGTSTRTPTTVASAAPEPGP
jgi:hypothetical protein